MRNPPVPFQPSTKKTKEEAWFKTFTALQGFLVELCYELGTELPTKKWIMHLKLQWKVNLLSMPENAPHQNHFVVDSGENIGIGSGINFTKPAFPTPPPSSIAVTFSNPNPHFPRPINTRHSWTGGRNPHQNGTRNSPASTKIFF